MSRSTNAGFNTTHEYIAKAHKRIDKLQGSLTRRGFWNAVSNTPEFSNNGKGGVKGDYYVVSASGTTNLDGVITWLKDDWIVNSGSKWEKASHSGGGGGAVTSVNGDIGDVSVTAASIGLGNVSNESSADILDNSNLTGETNINNIVLGIQSYTGGGVHDLAIDGLATNVYNDTSSTILPSSPTDGKIYTLINSGSGVVTVNASGGNTINNTGSLFDLAGEGESVTLQYTSNVWYFI